ncbi:MAG: radical SAM protein [Polyangiaceae bacterium]
MRRAEPRNQLTPVAMGVYVHFPWCLRKCPYCDFASLPAERREIPHDAYARAVVAELARRAEVLGEHRLESVFFGGGTPSLWHADALGSVLAAITRTFEPAAELEVTVECNPSTDYESARALADRGVNRFSIGVQSLDAERLASAACTTSSQASARCATRSPAGAASAPT